MEERIKALEDDMETVKKTVHRMSHDIAENKTVIQRIDLNTLEIVEAFKAIKWFSFVIKWTIVVSASAAAMWAYMSGKH